MSYEYKQFYRRKLPHIHSPGSTLFVTFRLAGSIPKTVLQQWLAEKALLSRKTVSDVLELEFRRRWFARFEEILDKQETGPTWLADSRIAEIVADSLKYRDGRDYSLTAYTIMSNHVHSVFAPKLQDRSLTEVRKQGRTAFISADPPLGAIMKSLKGYTARQANKVLQRTGHFWEEESYDHEIRNAEELYRVVRYVLNNPVKAGLVHHWSDWRWSYCRPDLGFSINPKTD